MPEEKLDQNFPEQNQPVQNYSPISSVIDSPKKILEESLITPKQEYSKPIFNLGSLEYIEQERDERRDRILKSLINGGGSIKEIASKLKDIGEKTIQRDLLELMRDKKVIMLGKKRWSKYYLK